MVVLPSRHRITSDHPPHMRTGYARIAPEGFRLRLDWSGYENLDKDTSQLQYIAILCILSGKCRGTPADGLHKVRCEDENDDLNYSAVGTGLGAGDGSWRYDRYRNARQELNASLSGNSLQFICITDCRACGARSADNLSYYR
jgi:hypothetical protein